MIESFMHRAERQPNKIALSDGKSHQSYSELVQKMKKVAFGLQQLGCNQDRIAILSNNRMEFVEIFLGIIYAGCIPVPLDPKWSSKEVNTILNTCQPNIIFSEEMYVQHRITPYLNNNNTKILTFGNELKGTYEDWLSEQFETATYITNEILFIGFTSGTTGIPKGYMRTPLSWIKSFEATNEAFKLHPMEHVCAPGPFVQSLSLFALMQSLYFGATFHMFYQFEVEDVIKRCSRYPSMILFVVPTMIEKLLEAVKEPLQVHAIISSGATWTENSKKRAKEVFGKAKLFEFYGSSEASYISYLNINDDHKALSVGKPFPSVKISIRDHHFQEVPQGEIGQLYIQSDLLFSGYYESPKETAQAFKNEWLQLGDYVYLDQDGCLYIVGRTKNRLISGGLNIYPEEVETVLKTAPDILEVMVTGLPDTYWGEKIIAVIQWKTSQQLTAEELKTYAAPYLSSYKLPKEIVTVEQFIYTSSGKIARQKMNDYIKEVRLCEMPSL